jgi:hypothetical protein
MKTQKTTDQTLSSQKQKQQHKNFEVRKPDGTDQLQQHSNFWITLQPHAAYNGSFCVHHTFHHLAATR